MKNFFAMLLALVMVLGLAACATGATSTIAQIRFNDSVAYIPQIKASAETEISQEQINQAVASIEAAAVKAYEAKFGGKVDKAQLELSYNFFNDREAVVHILAMDDGKEVYRKIKYQFPDLLWIAFNHQDFLSELDADVWWFTEMSLNRLVTSEVEFNQFGKLELVEDFSPNERSTEELEARLKSGELEAAYDQAVSYININLNVQGYNLNVAEVYWQSAAWVNCEAYAAKCDGREFVRPEEILWLVSTDGRVLAFKVQQGAVNEDLCYLRHADPEHEVFLIQFNPADGTVVADHPPLSISWFNGINIDPMKAK